jgi:hypothetical protein
VGVSPEQAKFARVHRIPPEEFGVFAEVSTADEAPRC